MAFRTADVEWQGDAQSGRGRIALGSGAFTGTYSRASRMQEEAETNPEELLGSALASCFTMSLAANLGRANYTPTRIHTTAKVGLSMGAGGFSIPAIDLVTEAVVPGIDAASFQNIALQAEQSCPVAKALTGTEIRLQATHSDK